MAFEDLGTAAYKGQAPNIRTRSTSAAAIAIHSVEARHAGWIRRLAGGCPPTPPFDEPLRATRVRAIVAKTNFVTAPPEDLERRRRSPRFTG